ncbi:MAG: helix-turn-helix transcriptional regulator [Pseudomonadota bacterium]
MDMKTIGKRIQKARKDKELRQADVANHLSVSKGAVSQWELDMNEPSTANLGLLAVYLDVSFEWLATGRGIQNINDHIIKLQDDFKHQGRSLFLDEAQFVFLKNYLELPEDLQESISHITKKFVSKDAED